MALLKLAYLGGGYHGLQYQPRQRTVEGELRGVLRRLGVLGGPGLTLCGRTDRGVSARAQIVSFEARRWERCLPRAINSHLPRDIMVWARSPQPLDARRDARWREYRYYCPDPGVRLAEMRRAARLLAGRHDFTALSADRGVIRTVSHASVSRAGGLLVLRFRSPGFAREMVRRMVTALLRVGTREENLEWLRGLLRHPRGRGVPPAPAEGLLFWDAGLPGARWEVDAYAVEKSREFLRGIRRNLEHRALLIGALDQGLPRGGP
ncbi:MAG: tRNA pseudouridine(38-40) synthase TruA [Euryarchaeota archaeon]|nr:tRNA pseudouridine(38-40) synthase TruA [Euryarchaeota archaeon]